jgi:hypothetical protein
VDFNGLIKFGVGSRLYQLDGFFGLVELRTLHLATQRIVTLAVLRHKVSSVVQAGKPIPSHVNKINRQNNQAVSTSYRSILVGLLLKNKLPEDSL